MKTYNTDDPSNTRDDDCITQQIDCPVCHGTGHECTDEPKTCTWCNISGGAMIVLAIACYITLM